MESREPLTLLQAFFNNMVANKLQGLFIVEQTSTMAIAIEGMIYSYDPVSIIIETEAGYQMVNLNNILRVAIMKSTATAEPSYEIM